MKLKRLIKNQRIKIDNHKPGQILDGDLQKVHLHKTFVGDYERRYVKIYLNGRLEFSRGFSKGQEDSLRKEIQGVLNENEEVLHLLSDTHSKAMYDWSEGKITLEKAQEYAKNFAESFGLKPAIKKEFIIKVGKSLRKYISVHKDDENNNYSIDQNKKRTYIYPDRVILAKKFEGDFDELPFSN